ncbi:hypothetical protein [Acinetobacter junii]|uniref:hypothetical protein n=1 Tax=Acinetobacter junii TaxID=40215 RepID=UPI000F69216E|nr:hypothetical protein [Acinetobacter junii]QXR26969.1 hypothetical protein EGT69_011815 [Acinetobacter junii]
MAVPVQTPFIEYVANGVTTNFSLGFDCENQSHLIVTVDDIEPIVGSWSLSVGAVVFNSAPISGSKIIIKRNSPFERDRDFQLYDQSFRPPAVNLDLDRIWRKLQELGVMDWLLSNRIDDLKNYVDDRDDELRAYLLEEIIKQGVALDQLEDYYNYLMQRLAEIAVNQGWDASFVVDGNLTQHERNKGIKSIAQLRLTAPAIKGDRVYLASVNEDQGEGGGEFVATQKSGLVDNGGTIIASPNPLIFWVRQNVVEVTPEMFGAKGGSSDFDSHSALQAAFLSGYPARLNSAMYYTSKPLYHKNSFKLTGNGYWGKSQIFKTTSDASDLADVVCPNGTDAVSYAKDAVLIAYPNAGDYVHDVNIDGVFLGKIYEGEVGDGYFMEGIAYYAPYIAQSTFKSMQLNACRHSFYSVNQWMCSFERVEGACYWGWVIGGLDGDIHRGGTTSSYTSCWSKNVYGLGANAWNFHKMVSVTMNSCGTDGFGSDSFLGGYIIKAEHSEIIVNGFGWEGGWAAGYVLAEDSTVIMTSIYTYQVNNLATYSQIMFHAVRSKLTVQESTMNFATTELTNLGVFAQADDNSIIKFINVTTNPMYRDSIQGGQTWEFRAFTNSYVRFELAGRVVDYLAGNHPAGLTNTLSLSGGVQSRSTTIDFGLMETLGGRLGNNYFRLGSLRMFTNSSGRLRYTVNGIPVGDADGYNLGGVDIGDSDPATPLNSQLFYNRTTGKLKLRDGANWVEFSKSN